MITTDHIKDLPHLVIVTTDATITVAHHIGPGCMERAHDHALRVSLENPAASVTVALRIRTITGPDAMHLHP